MIDVYQMPEALGGDWAFRVGFPHMLISDGYASEEAARKAAQDAVAGKGYVTGVIVNPFEAYDFRSEDA